MNYNLKSTTEAELLWVIDALLLHKSKYENFLTCVNEGKELPKRGFSLEKLRYRDGETLEDFDNEIIKIQNELDKRSGQ